MTHFTINPWITRIANAEKTYQEWESKFMCRKLYDYYENFQWKGRTSGTVNVYRPYTLNLIFSTIKIKMATWIFQRPDFLVTAEPGHSHYDLDAAVKGAQLKQDVLNTIIKNPNIKFAHNIKYTALDSFFWYGLTEVGYAADWRNPLKDDMHLNSWDNPDITGEEDTRLRVIEQNDVPVNERMYAKRIKPWRFRVSNSDAEELADHEWVGYFQYYYKDILQKTPGIKFPKDYSSSTISSDSINNFSMDSTSGLYLASNTGNRQLCKVWRIWDLVAHKQLLLLDGYDEEGYELWSQEFENLPLVDLKWNLRASGFYPIPPVWYWLSSQDEINEAREQVRSYRRRFTSKYQVVTGQIDTEEEEKFVSGPDGVLIKVKEKDAISPINNPEIGPTSENALLQGKDDFNIISATSAEARGQSADRQTATAAKLVDARSQIRESAEQLDFTEYVSLVGREILVQAKERLAEGLWVKYSSNPSEGVLQDMAPNMPVVKWVRAADLDDGYDFNVSVDVRNATPAAMETEKQSFISFCAILTQFPMIAMSPILIREAAYRVGYKNETVIAQMQQVALLSMTEKVAQKASERNMTLADAEARTNGGGANSQSTINQQMQSPDINTIQKQIGEQLG